MFYTTKEAAEILGLSEARVRQLCQSGELKSQKFGRDWHVKKSAIKSYLNKKNKKGDKRS
jgi:excisionase family DNA binding protein